MGGDPVKGGDLNLAGTRQSEPDQRTYDVGVNGHLHGIPSDQWDATIYSDTCNSYRPAALNKSIGNPYDYSAPVLPIPEPPSGGGVLNGVGDFLKKNVGGGVSATGRVAGRTLRLLRRPNSAERRLRR